MGILTSKLILSSPAGNISSDALSIELEDSLTTTRPNIGVSRVGIEVGGGSDTTLVPSSVGNKYVYIKHTGFASDGITATENEVVVDFGTTDSIRLSSGEFTFFPAKESTLITAISNHTSTILIEYAYWTKG